MRQHTLWLTVSFVAMHLVFVLLFTSLLMVPMARRAADDLAGLVVLSAQTWSELPPAARDEFLQELRANHELDLRPAMGYSAASALHPPFVYFFERAINRRLATAVHLLREENADEVWYWVNVPSGGDQVAVGWPEKRNDSRPLTAAGIGLLLSLLASWWLARWLAGRIVRPLRQLTDAMTVVGEGSTPDRLSEDGPQELATVSHRFNVMVQQVEALLSARTALLAGISHDLRTPLTRMQLTLAILRETPSPVLLDRLETEMHRLNQLIGQTLDLARGLHREEPQLIEVDPWLQDIAAGFQNLSTGVLTLSNHGLANVAPVAMRRCLGNLVENALRYAGSSPVELVFERHPTGDRFGVLDRGPGIPAEELARLQEPYERLGAPSLVVSASFGLGLSIVNELARANGWTVRFSAREGGGLEAWINLQAAHPEDANSQGLSTS